MAETKGVDSKSFAHHFGESQADGDQSIDSQRGARDDPGSCTGDYLNNGRGEDLPIQESHRAMILG